MSEKEEKNEPNYSFSRFLETEAGERLRIALRNPEVRRECIAAFGLVCPPPANYLLFYAVEKLTLSGVSWIGRAAGSHVDALLMKSGTVRRLFQRIERLAQQEAEVGRLKDRLIEDMRVAGAAEEISPSASLEVVQAIYQRSKLEGLPSTFQELLNGLRGDVEDMLRRIDAERNDPNLAWRPLREADGATALSTRLNYRSRAYAFKGRETEMELLEEFLGDPTCPGAHSRFKWLLITGPGGEGKSRLGFEVTKLLREERGWNAGRLALGDLAQFDPSRWRPRRDSFIVIDYPAQAAEKVHQLLRAFAERASDFDFRVRILMLERDAQESWISRLLPHGGDSDLVLEHVFTQRGQIEGAIALSPLGSQAIYDIMCERFRDAGIEPPERISLLEAAHRIDNRTVDIQGKTYTIPRALFAMAAAEVLILELEANPATDVDRIVQHMQREPVLQNILRHDREWRWERAPGGQTAATLRAHENLLAIATICLGLAAGELENLPPGAAPLLPGFHAGAPVAVEPALIEAMTQYQDGVTAGLEPDILGELFALSHLESIGTRASQALIDAAWELAPFRTMVFVARSYRDFPVRIGAFNYLCPTAAVGEAAIDIFMTLVAQLSRALLETGQLAEVERFHTHLMRTFIETPSDHIISWLGQLNTMVIGQAGEHGAWDLVSSSLNRLDSLTAQHAQNVELAAAAADAAFNIGSDAIRLKSRPKLAEALSRLDHLDEQFPGEVQIAISQARLCVLMGLLSGPAFSWELADDALARIERLSLRFPEVSEIALRKAKCLVNIGREAGRQGDLAKFEACFEQLRTLQAQHSEDAEISLRLARYIANGIRMWERSRGREATDAMLAIVAALLASFPDNPEIARQYAECHYAIIVETHESDLERAGASGREILAVLARFGNDDVFAPHVDRLRLAVEMLGKPVPAPRTYGQTLRAQLAPETPWPAEPIFAGEWREVRGDDAIHAMISCGGSPGDGELYCLRYRMVRARRLELGCFGEDVFSYEFLAHTAEGRPGIIEVVTDGKQFAMSHGSPEALTRLGALWGFAFERRHARRQYLFLHLAWTFIGSAERLILVNAPADLKDLLHDPEAASDLENAIDPLEEIGWDDEDGRWRYKATLSFDGILRAAVLWLSPVGTVELMVGTTILDLGERWRGETWQFPLRLGSEAATGASG